MDPALALALTALALVILLAAHVHIGLALALVGFLGLVLLGDLEPALQLLGSRPFSVASSYLLAVIPLFVLMGQLALSSGISKDTFDFAQKSVGRLPGGLASSTAVTSGLFSATTGSSVATVATVGTIALPEMRRYRYDDKLATGSVAAAGVLGVLIPPSVILVIYAQVTGESLGALLLAGIIPGILTVLAFVIMITARCAVNSELGPRSESASLKDALLASRRIWGVLLLFVAVMGSIYLGFATPTEAAALGAATGLLVAVFRTRLSWKGLLTALRDTAGIVGMIGLILIGASIYATFVAFTGIPGEVAELVQDVSIPPLVILILTLLLLVPMGMFLDPTSMILIVMPVIYTPLISLGFNGVWFGIIMVKMVELALITPPVGFNVFVTKSVAQDVRLEQIFRGIGWFVLTDIVLIAMLIAFPEIVLWLPSSVE